MNIMSNVSIYKYVVVTLLLLLKNQKEHYLFLKKIEYVTWTLKI